MDSPMELEESRPPTVFDHLAGEYDFTYGRWLERGRRAAVDAMSISPGMRVLEIGIGTGLSLPLYASSQELVGVDISTPMLRKAREQVARLGMTNVELYTMSAEALRLPDASFDRVFAPSVLSVVDRPERAVAEMIRVCRPDGLICVVAHLAGRTWYHRVVDRLLDPLTRRFLGYRMTTSRESLHGNPALRLIHEASIYTYHFNGVYLFSKTVTEGRWADAEASLPSRRASR